MTLNFHILHHFILGSADDFVINRFVYKMSENNKTSIKNLAEPDVTSSKVFSLLLYSQSGPAVAGLELKRFIA